MTAGAAGRIERGMPGVVPPNFPALIARDADHSYTDNIVAYGLLPGGFRRDRTENTFYQWKSELFVSSNPKKLFAQWAPHDGEEGVSGRRQN